MTPAAAPDVQPSERLFYLTVKKHIPFSFTCEITYRCPLECRHCYLPETQGDLSPEAHRELSTAEWKHAFEELAEAGCLYLTLTGGEVFVRPDAAELARHARALGFDTKIYTTGVLLTAPIADELADLGLSAVELSLYGREFTHDFMTKRPGSFRKTLAAIDLLRERDVPVKIKCPMMKANWLDRHFLIQLAGEKGLKYQFDPTVTPRNDAGRQPLGLRLSPDQTLELLDDPAMTTPEHIERVREDYHDDSFLCSAGKNLGGVNPFGDVYPCLQLPVPAGNLREKSFREIWSRSPELARLRAIRFSDLSECSRCAIKDYCSRCPGITLLEEGDILGPSRVSCALAKAQYEKVHGPTDYVPAGLRPDFRERPQSGPAGGCGGGCRGCPPEGASSAPVFLTRYDRIGHETQGDRT